MLCSFGVFENLELGYTLAGLYSIIMNAITVRSVFFTPSYSPLLILRSGYLPHRDNHSRFDVHVPKRRRLNFGTTHFKLWH